jgi:murein DD-endopeptidase MepM/ murein hydrolase activator NlpD
MAVANGTIARKGYGRGNGNFITIRHDKTYTTTYLHMSKFAKGIKKGVHVKQGQVIGYVGSTGLATGPHVCFRMKKNGKPIDHLRENFPSPEPLPDSVITNYYTHRDSILKLMNRMEIKTKKYNALVNYGFEAKYIDDEL